MEKYEIQHVGSSKTEEGASTPSLIRCGQCGQSAYESLVICPHCGRELHPASSKYILWRAPIVLIVLVGVVLATWGTGLFAFTEGLQNLEAPAADNRAVEPQVTLATPVTLAEPVTDESMAEISQGSVDESELITRALSTTATEQDSSTQMQTAAEGTTEEVTGKETNTATLLPTNITQLTVTATPETLTPTVSQANQSIEAAIQRATEPALSSGTKDGTDEESTFDTGTDRLDLSVQASIAQRIVTDAGADQGVITIASLRATQRASVQQTTSTNLAQTAATQTPSSRSVTGISIALNTATPTESATSRIALEIGENENSVEVLTRAPTNTPTKISTNTPTNTASATIHSTSTPTEVPNVTYVIRGGDTLLGIARQFDTTVEALMTINSFTAEDVRRLRPGSELVIPNASPTTAVIKQSERPTPTAAPVRT